MCISRLFAADLFFEKLQMPQKYGQVRLHARLRARAARGNVQSCSATFSVVALRHGPARSADS